MVLMAHSLKVPKDKFEGAIRALLNTPPTPLVEIPQNGRKERSVAVGISFNQVFRFHNCARVAHPPSEAVFGMPTGMPTTCIEGG